MAGIMHKTSRLMAAVLLGCLLAGCGGQLLSHREIVRAELTLHWHHPGEG